MEWDKFLLDRLEKESLDMKDNERKIKWEKKETLKVDKQKGWGSAGSKGSSKPKEGKVKSNQLVPCDTDSDSDVNVKKEVFKSSDSEEGEPQKKETA